MKATTFAEDPTQIRTLTTSAESHLVDCFYAIRDFISQKKPKAAILFYTHNRGNGILVTRASPLVLKACASLSLLSFGKMLHSEILKSGVGCNVIVGSALVDMYAKCHDVESSRKVFDELPEKNAVTWNAIIGGYMRNGCTQHASMMFEKMPKKTPVTWIELIDGYARNGDIAIAREVKKVPEEMKNIITWTVMVDGLVRNGDMDAAMEVFERMTKTNFYVWSIMITGYFKKGDAVKAREIFDRMNVRNLVNWNSLISGYAQNGMPEEALQSFVRMQEEGFEPNEVTLASVLSACSQSGMLDAGKKVHDMILNKKIQVNEFVLNGLVDMYAKCGDLENAWLIFKGMAIRNTATWNSLITGFAIHGQCREAIAFFSQMESSSAKPDDVTFLSVLSACAHGGFVKEGLAAFSKMGKYGLRPNVKHYGCLVDLLGRAGILEEAYRIVRNMPMAPNDTIFGTLLGACRIYSDTTMAENVLELVKKVNSDRSFEAHYVLLSSIYAASERWEMAEGMRVAFSSTGSEKTPGCSALFSGKLNCIDRPFYYIEGISTREHQSSQKYIQTGIKDSFY